MFRNDVNGCQHFMESYILKPITNSSAKRQVMKKLGIYMYIDDKYSWDAQYDKICSDVAGNISE